MRARRSWHLENYFPRARVMIVGARRFVDRPSACYIHTERYALFSYMYIHVVVVVVACYRAILLIVASRAIPTAALLPPKTRHVSRGQFRRCDGVVLRARVLRALL
mmetsp:Transcript_6881/g.15269  ORF Transcript_6881/g.15269 Transcript_6881/m.15269 type:complete len:106 (-) Transcript_6881:694-1011(-)